MAESLSVAVRTEFGKRRNRRLRQAGSIPAVLYGHGEENLTLAVGQSEFATAIRHGARMVQLTGGANDTALIREIQWDTFGVEVQHLDLLRVKAGETVEMAIMIELRGQAPGVSEGGTVEQLLHELLIECPVQSIPEKIEININSLALDSSITASTIELPEGATSLVDGEAIVVQCVEKVELTDEEEDGLAGGVEPEVIGRKESDEDGDA